MTDRPRQSEVNPLYRDKRDAQAQRRHRRKRFEQLVTLARKGHEGAQKALSKLCAPPQGTVTVAGTRYSVDEKGTYRREGK